MIKNIIKNPKKINGEYILLFIVLAGLGFLFYSPKAVSQQPPQEIIINSLQPAPYGEFNELKAEVYRDYHNPTNRFVDPMGESQVQTLNIETRLIVEYIGGPPDVDPLYEVDYTNGDANLNVVYSRRMIMDDAGPPTRRAGGKFVYDIAEGVFAKGDCQAGDVVLISDDEKSDVMKSSGRFANRIAGVISTEPKIYMGANKQKVPLALAGVVKCKASAENGNIKKGDLLVSASLPGHAMKAMPHEVYPGMVIGKALEPLNEDTGQILILVNKQ